MMSWSSWSRSCDTKVSLPDANAKISAFLILSLNCSIGVLEWAMVIVELYLFYSNASGNPTVKERPIISAFFEDTSKL